MSKVPTGHYECRTPVSSRRLCYDAPLYYHEAQRRSPPKRFRKDAFSAMSSDAHISHLRLVTPPKPLTKVPLLHS